MDQYEYERYVATSDTLKATLEKYGVAIIPNVINQEQCAVMREKMWESFEHITQHFDVPMDRNNVDSWKSFNLLFPLHSMLIQRYSLAHSQYYWDLRQNTDIVDIFANLWGTKREELLVSFDGLSLHLPPEQTGRGWYKNNNWMHTDSGFNSNNIECVQSFLTANEIREGDATFCFLEGSHKLHKRVGKKFKITDKGDWYKFNEKEYDYYLKKGCERKCIKCPAGSMVFWFSKTVHSGQEPLKERKIENERCIVYLCYTPRIHASQANLKKKIKAFEDLRTTNHLAHKPKLFPVNPRTYGGPMPKIEPIKPPILNNLGKRLTGAILTAEELISEHLPKTILIDGIIKNADIESYMTKIYTDTL